MTVGRRRETRDAEGRLAGGKTLNHRQTGAAATSASSLRFWVLFPISQHTPTHTHTHTHAHTHTHTHTHTQKHTRMFAFIIDHLRVMDLVEMEILCTRNSIATAKYFHFICYCKIFKY